MSSCLRYRRPGLRHESSKSSLNSWQVGQAQRREVTIGKKIGRSEEGEHAQAIAAPINLLQCDSLGQVGGSLVAKFATLSKVLGKNASW